MKPVYLSPSAVLEYEDCPRKYFHDKVERREPEVMAATMVFGRVVHRVCTEHVLARAEARDHSLTDRSTRFGELWHRARAEQAMDFGSRYGFDDLLAMGERLCATFVEAWRASGLTPVLSDEGPLVERKLHWRAEGVRMRLIPDVVAMDERGSIVVVDIKTPQQASDEEFLSVFDQLTAYQLAVEQSAARFGIAGVDELALMEAPKRKVDAQRGLPRFETPKRVPARGEADKAEYRQKIQDVAGDVRAGRFPRRPRMPHNTPCAMCDFRRLCYFGDAEGLTPPAHRRGRQARAAAA